MPPRSQPLLLALFLSLPAAALAAEGPVPPPTPFASAGSGDDAPLVSSGFRVGLPPFGTGRHFGRYYEVSLLEAPNGAFFAGSGSGPLRGLRIHEHAGPVGTLIINVLAVMGIAMSAVHIDSNTTVIRDDSYVRETRTVTTYTQVKSDAEVAAEIDGFRSESAGMPFTYALEFYSPQLPGLAGTTVLEGFGWELGAKFGFDDDLPLASRGLPWVLDVGVAGSSLKPVKDAPPLAAGLTEMRDLSLYGRLAVPVTEWFEAHALLRLNVFSITDEVRDGYVSPCLAAVGFSANVTDRFFLRATVNQALFRTWNNWIGVEAGVRL